MHFGATQFLIVRLLTGCCLEQCGAGQVGLAVALHADHIITHPGHVGTARRRGSVQYHESRYTGGTQSRQAGEDSATFHPHLHLVFQQVGASTFHQVNEGQFLVPGNLHGADPLAGGQGSHGAGIDTGIIHHQHTAHAADITNTTDHIAAGHGSIPAGVIHHETSHVEDLQEWHAGIQHTAQPLSWQQLPTPLELLQGFVGQGRGPVENFPQGADEIQHIRAVALELLGSCINIGMKQGHGNTLGASKIYRVSSACCSASAVGTCTVSASRTWA